MFILFRGHHYNKTHALYKILKEWWLFDHVETTRRVSLVPTRLYSMLIPTNVDTYNADYIMSNSV